MLIVPTFLWVTKAFNFILMSKHTSENSFVKFSINLEEIYIICRESRLIQTFFCDFDDFKINSLLFIVLQFPFKDFSSLNSV